MRPLAYRRRRRRRRRETLVVRLVAVRSLNLRRQRRTAAVPGTKYCNAQLSLNIDFLKSCSGYLVLTLSLKFFEICVCNSLITCVFCLFFSVGLCVCVCCLSLFAYNMGPWCCLILMKWKPTDSAAVTVTVCLCIAICPGDCGRGGRCMRPNQCLCANGEIAPTCRAETAQRGRLRPMYIDCCSCLCTVTLQQFTYFTGWAKSMPNIDRFSKFLRKSVYPVVGYLVFKLSMKPEMINTVAVYLVGYLGSKVYNMQCNTHHTNCQQ